MKHAILLTVLLSTSAAQAAEPTKEDLCSAWGKMAAKIMELRQDDAPMSDVMKIAAKGSISERQRKLVIAAYNEPAFVSDGRKKQAADSFRNKIELECFKSKD